jgi:hypothetical protein
MINAKNTYDKIAELPELDEVDFEDVVANKNKVICILKHPK